MIGVKKQAYLAGVWQVGRLILDCKIMKSQSYSRLKAYFLIITGTIEGLMS